ncbi:hypothetical protein H5407_20570 [Mitsuaria sp. WAJ17]|uniref:hypothetical protein n=1 Tax=Mitsuaria sp. WAJ17 TaxID=2761452 RepID=UPI0016038160|nr:hypothetical protein [Mitsuaria sp. WAJ17]MBB2487637.1 hypothetical protein [Mitsuaria sp. WAJ17]
MPTAGSPRRWQAHALALATALLAILTEQAVVQQSTTIANAPWALVSLALVCCVLAGALPSFTLLLGGLALAWLAGTTGLAGLLPPAPKRCWPRPCWAAQGCCWWRDDCAACSSPR